MQYLLIDQEFQQVEDTNKFLEELTELKWSVA